MECRNLLLSLLLLVVAANICSVSANCLPPECKYVDPYPLNQCPADKTLIITINTGDYPEEIDWTLKKEDGAYVSALRFRTAASQQTIGGYDGFEPYAIYKEYVCLKGLPFAQNYTLRVFGNDDYFDGFRCNGQGIDCLIHDKVEGDTSRRRQSGSQVYTGNFSGCGLSSCGDYSLALADGTLLASGNFLTLGSLSSSGDGNAPVQFSTGSGGGDDDDLSYDCSNRAIRAAGGCIPTDGNCNEDDYYTYDCDEEPINMNGIITSCGCPVINATETNDDRRALAARDEGFPAARRKTIDGSKYVTPRNPMCFHAQQQTTQRTYGVEAHDSCVDDEITCVDGSSVYRAQGRNRNKTCKNLKRKLNKFRKATRPNQKKKLKKKIKKECKRQLAGSPMRVWDYCVKTCSAIGKGKCVDIV